MKRKIWTKNWLQKRDDFSHINLLKELRFSPNDWNNYMRMNEKTYLELLSLVTPLIQKHDTYFRRAISPHERLTATLSFLATGRSYEALKDSTLISPQALGKIIPETCDALYKVLRKEYFKFPKTEEDWRSVSQVFEERWNLPHCLGVIDGRHIEISPPGDSTLDYCNYKGRNSMVLLAIVDGNYQVLLCDFGTNGGISDGGVLRKTKFYEKLQNKTLNIPKEDKVMNSARVLPYVFIADDPFPLREDMLKPYRIADLSSNEKKIFNNRLCRAGRIIENVFGIMAARFRILNTRFFLKPDKIDSVVMACCVLHNFLIKKTPRTYLPAECFDQEIDEAGTVVPGLDTAKCTMINLERRTTENSPPAAKIIRERFVNYFSNDGSV